MITRYLSPKKTAKLSVVLLCISAIVLVFSPTAKQYEVSIYNHTPLFLWISLGFSLLLIITTIINKYGKLVNISGILLIFYTILYSIPATRGYHLYGRGNSDILTHIGYAKAVNETLSWYPAIHIEMRILHEWGHSWEFVATILAVVFSFLFAFGAALYARSLLNKRHTWMVTLAASVIPILGPFTRSNHPAVYSFMLLPLALWLARRGKQEAEMRYFASTLVLSSIIIVFHPVTSVLLIIGLMIDNIQTHASLEKSNTLIPVYIGVVAVVWYTGFSRFTGIIGVVTAPNIGGAAAAPTTAIMDPALSPLDIIYRAIEMYGAIAIIGILGGIATVVLIRGNLQDREQPADGVLIGHYLMSGIFGASFLIIDLVVSAPIRVARYGVLASLLTLPNLTRSLSGQKRTVASIIIIVFLTVALTLSLGSVYESNEHFTESEYEGAIWQTNYHSEGMPVYAHDMGKKVDFYLFGADTDRSIFASLPIPSQLGYSSTETVGDSIGEGYIVTKSYDLLFVDVFVEGKRSRQMVYSEEDVERLDIDSAANSVYSNGGYTVWCIC